MLPAQATGTIHRPRSGASSRQPPSSASAVPIVCARSNGVVLCGSTMASHHQVVGGAVPYRTCSATPAGSAVRASGRWSSCCDATTATTASAAPAQQQPGRCPSIGQVEPADGDAGREIGDPGKHGVVARQHQLREQRRRFGDVDEDRAGASHRR
jgi:hypothetical protein